MATPEMDKQAAADDKAATIAEFLDWLLDTEHGGQTVGLWKGVDQDGFPFNWSPPRAALLADFFAIDLGRVELERRSLDPSLKPWPSRRSPTAPTP